MFVFCYLITKDTVYKDNKISSFFFVLILPIRKQHLLSVYFYFLTHKRFVCLLVESNCVLMMYLSAIDYICRHKFSKLKYFSSFEFCYPHAKIFKKLVSKKKSKSLTNLVISTVHISILLYNEAYEL